MGDNFSRYEQWAAAQAAAFAAEHRVAQAALRHAAGAGPAPALTDLQGALILRCKANALLTAMVSGSNASSGAVDGIDLSRTPSRSGMDA